MAWNFLWYKQGPGPSVATPPPTTAIKLDRIPTARTVSAIKKAKKVC